MTEHSISDPSFIVITGTHSAGKSTLLSDIEVGKLETLGITNIEGEYDDFGYGLAESDSGIRPFVTVPETARWCADLYKRPDFLAENYNLGFQLNIDSQALFRTHAAAFATKSLTASLKESGDIPSSQTVINPLVVSDRSAMDGVVYSELRIPKDTNIVFGSPRTGFISEWLKTYTDLAVVVDHNEVEFEDDAARLSELDFRDTVNRSIRLNYEHFLGSEKVVSICGNRENRVQKFLQLIGQVANTSADRQFNRPYQEWSQITLVDSGK